MKDIWVQLEIIEHGGAKYKLTVALRERVLRQPLGLQFNAAELAAESTCLHFAGSVNDQVIACCVTNKKQQGWFQVRQVAVDFDFQRRGYGQRLMEFVHRHVASLGGKQVFCHARDVAVPFYGILGYQMTGEYFEEISIQHIRMEKNLWAAPAN